MRSSHGFCRLDVLLVHSWLNVGCMFQELLHALSHGKFTRPKTEIVHWRGWSSHSPCISDYWHILWTQDWDGWVCAL